MLRNVIIIGSTSGLVLFSKSFTHGITNARMTGSLITAIIEFGQQTTGMGVCYIELTNVSVTMVANDDAKVVCALFYDRDDGVLFGRLICTEILNAFTQEYSYDITQYGKNLKDFYGFQKKIGHIVRFSTKSVITKLESHRGIIQVLFMNEREIIHRPDDEVDQLSILANLSAFMELCSGISKLPVCVLTVCTAPRVVPTVNTATATHNNAALAVASVNSINDTAQHVALESSCQHTVHMWRIQEHSVLVVAVDNKVDQEEYLPHIDEALELIEQVCILYSYLEQSAR
jgi:hypothetical protein